ncbi:hypothetical protein [Rhodocista pekingensis]|uniref:DUF4178 domain-containing protein n=1 Tax=Rhodocista pekingensis TaxID=201185 RepID=A0ABW2KX47_9PROT
MGIHTTRTTVTFRHPFRLDGFDTPWPPGLYEVETDEEDLQDLSFPSRRRIRTMIYRQDKEHGISEAVPITPDALAAALAVDVVQGNPAPPPDGAGPAADPHHALPRGRGGIQITPVWVVPLVIGVCILLAAWFGPFSPPGTPPAGKGAVGPSGPGPVSSPPDRPPSGRP